MKSDKDKESNWEDYFKQLHKKIGMPDYEKSTLNRINRIIQEVKNPQERISKLKKIKDAINAYNYAPYSWSGTALKRTKSGIQMAEDEIKYNQETETSLSHNKSTQTKPHNFSGYPSEKCIKDLKKYRNENPEMPVNKFFETAYNRYPSCRRFVLDGKEISIKWSTLLNRIKELHPEIYNRKK